MSSYNYARFSMRLFPIDRFAGPRAGEPFPDFELSTLDGDRLDQSCLEGRWTVIESGSITCPMYLGQMKTMDRLRRRFADVEFLLLYVREAHPGGRLGPHRHQDAKRSAAATARRLGETRTILVDDLDGALHRAIGSMPEAVYLVGPDGRVVHRQDWCTPRKIAEILQRRDASSNPKDRHGIALPPPWVILQATLRGGWIALWDVIVNLPALGLAHFGSLRSDQYPPQGNHVDHSAHT